MRQTNPANGECQIYIYIIEFDMTKEIIVLIIWRNDMHSDWNLAFVYEFKLVLIHAKKNCKQPADCEQWKEKEIHNFPSNAQQYIHIHLL